MKKILLFVFLIPSVLAAQTKIKGIIKDNKGELLIGVNVSIENTYDGGTTNKDGEYTFETEASDSVTIVANYIGYVTQKKKIFINSKNLVVDFILKEKLNDLKAVVITAGAFEASDEKKGTTLNSIDIVTTAGSNGDSYGALKTLPGAQQNNDKEGLFVRGGTAWETQTFIDGTWVRNSFLSSVPDLGSRGRFNPFIFKGTTFSTGGYSALYGGALSSAVILETTDLANRNEGFFNLTTLGFGAGTQLLAKDKKTSAGISLNYVNLGPYFALAKQNINYKKAPTSSQIDLNFRRKLGKTGLLKFYGYANMFSLNIQRPNITSYDYNDVSKQYNDEFSLKNKNVYTNLSYKNSLGKEWKLLLGLCASYNKDDIHTKIVNQQNELVSDSNFAGINNFEINNYNTLLTIKSVLQKTFNGLNAFRFGAEYAYTNDDSKTIYSIPNVEDHYKAIFAETDFYITNDIAGKVGVRAEHASVMNKFNIAPRVSAAYKVHRNAQISLAYGIFYQKPEYQYLREKTNLDFLRADHYILNYQFKPKDRVFRIEVYYKQYYKLIKTKPLFNLYQPSNNGTGYARGLELFYRDKKLIKGIDFWISYSFIDTKRNFLNYLKEVQPDFVATHSSSLVVKKFWTKYMFGINGTYTYASGRPYINYNKTNPYDTNPNVDLFMSDRTVDYHTVNLSFNYIKSIKKTFMVFFMGVNNPLRINQTYGYNYASRDLNHDGIYYRSAIKPTAKTFIFLGMFASLGIDRSQEIIDGNL
ncbi:MAG: TonB-dependent receptor [Chitinophagaceae bacterium]